MNGVLLDGDYFLAEVGRKFMDYYYAQQPAAVGPEHTHPHKKRANCHCSRCRPLERPCDCGGCAALIAALAGQQGDPQ